METSRDFPYYDTHTFKASLCGQDIQVVSKPGLPHWSEVTPSIQLLAGVADMRREGRALQLSCGHGALGVALARQHGGDGLCLMDPSWIAVRVAKKTLALNGYPSVPVEPLQYKLPMQSLQTILIDLPKGRKLARRWLVEAWEALQPEGELYLAGANGEGIQSVIQDAGNLFGNATILAYRKGCRVARMIKPSATASSPLGSAPDWVNQPGIASGSWVDFAAKVCGERLTIHSLPGIFSFDRVDEGSDLLLQQLNRGQVQEKKVLDFGCGYGLIGMAVARLGAARVDLIDVDLPAVAATRENLSLNGITNARVQPSDVLDAVRAERYDLILTNPPFHAGKQVEYVMAHTLIAHARQVLNQDGRLVLVANRFIRYDRLMMEVFGNVERLAETGKFHVLVSYKGVS